MKKKKLALVISILALLILLLLGIFTAWLWIENAAYRNSLETMQMENAQLENSWQETYDAYEQQLGLFANLQQQYIQLNSSYLELLEENAELEQEKAEVQEAYADVSALRLPHEIPSSSIVSGLDLLLTPQALLFSYPGLYVVTGENTTSMHPTIGVGQVALVTRDFDPYALQVGDIVAYNTSTLDVPVAHRIIEIKEEGCYILQGDNNPRPDRECVKPQEVVYQVVGVLYGSNPEGFQNCPEGYAGLALNGKLECVSKTIPAGVYLTNQSIDQGEGYPLCANVYSTTRYTVVSPGGKVYCEDR